MAEADGSSNTSPAARQFIFLSPPKFFEGFEIFEEKETVLTPAILAFKSNLNSAILVGSIPYTLTLSAVFEESYSRHSSAERIKSLMSDYPRHSSEDESRAYVHEQIMKGVHEEFGGEEGRLKQAKRILQSLSSHMQDEGFLLSSNELLRQVLVMTWGAFETLTNDLIRCLLNFRPDISRVLFDSLHFREVLGNRRNFLDLLARYNFDLSVSIGDIFCDEAKLDSLEKIRDVVQHLFPSGKLLQAVGDARLWRIAQQRHLIVHRRGIVDQKYLMRTGDTEKLGALISFDSGYIGECLWLVRDVGLAFADEASAALFSETRS
ncbi:hypothetical protein [Parvibaculum sp.]|uniref:hypothetical protein n=1 Tax=Parvibaculum sp. TaxID=2024848 RepID=UPI003BAB7C90